MLPERTVEWAGTCTTCGEATRLEPTLYGGTQKIHSKTGDFLCKDLPLKRGG